MVRYGTLKKEKVIIMEKATKKYAPKGYIVIQSIKTGETATIKRNQLKNITKK